MKEKVTYIFHRYSGLKYKLFLSQLNYLLIVLFKTVLFLTLTPSMYCTLLEKSSLNGTVARDFFYSVFFDDLLYMGPRF
jgi:hypothetical protein